MPSLVIHVELCCLSRHFFYSWECVLPLSMIAKDISFSPVIIYWRCNWWCILHHRRFDFFIVISVYLFSLRRNLAVDCTFQLWPLYKLYWGCLSLPSTITKNFSFRICSSCFQFGNWLPVQVIFFCRMMMYLRMCFTSFSRF